MKRAMLSSTCLIVLFLSGALAYAQGVAVDAARRHVGGTGTPGRVPVWVDPNTIGDSAITQGSDGSLNVNGTAMFGLSITTSNPNGVGVVGVNTSTDPGGNGVFGEVRATTGFAFGVQGSAHNSGAGVQGINDSDLGSGVAGINNSASGGTGVIGVAKAITGFTSGVKGIGHGSGGVGVSGVAPFQGVAGINEECDALGCTPAAGTAGVFTTASGGNILIGYQGVSSDQWIPMFRVDSTGQVFANGGYQTGGADFAESMAVSGERSRYEPGDVVVIEETGNRQVALARQPYSTLVAGIHSTKPGVLATPHPMDDPRLPKEIPLALVGIVPCKVTAENGAIKTGDLLVTSSVPGHAMKGTDRTRMLGAVVGKALEPLASGTGVIQVLITLQ
jgi:hypothetical protein